MDQPSVREEFRALRGRGLDVPRDGSDAATVRRYARAAWFAWIQVTIEGSSASILVSMTGGPVSPLFPLFFLNVIAATFVLPGRGAVVVAGIDLVLYIVLLNTIGLTGLSTIMGGDLLLNYSQILLQVFAFLLVGMLSSVLSGNLRATRRALARQVAETEVLRARHDLILEQVDAGVLVLDQGAHREPEPSRVACWVGWSAVGLMPC